MRIFGQVFCLVAIAGALKGTDHPRIPIVFEANRGQVPEAFSFVSRGSGYALGIGDRSAVVQAGGRTWTMRLLPPPTDSPAASSPVGQDPLPGRSHYFRGAQWNLDIPHFAGVRQSEVYRRIDLVWHGSDSAAPCGDGASKVLRRCALEYDFRIRPGGDPRDIRIRFEGLDNVALSGGDLVLSAGGQRFLQPKPFLYQETPAGRAPVAGGYRLDGGIVSFDAGRYDRSRELVIDPVLAWSAVVGGSGEDAANAVAVDSSGNVYITGRTASLDFPTAGPKQANSGGGETDAFVTYPANLCPLLCCGEFAEFSEDFGEPVRQTIEDGQ